MRNHNISFSTFVLLLGQLLLSILPSFAWLPTSIPKRGIRQNTFDCPKIFALVDTALQSSKQGRDSLLRQVGVGDNDDEESIDSEENDDDDDDFGELDDETLLQSISKEEMWSLCEQFPQLQEKITSDISKEEMLLLLRQHAADLIEQEQRQQEKRILRVEGQQEGDSVAEEEYNSKERYELVEDDGSFDEYDDEPVIYLSLDKLGSSTAKDDSSATSSPAIGTATTTSTTTISDVKKEPSSTSSSATPPPSPPLKKKPSIISHAAVTAPPPPDSHPVNENGERVVTVYSTTDENDLTGIAAAQPGRSSASLDSLSNSDGTSDMDLPSSASFAGKADSRETEKAKEIITELVETLLAMTGLPAYVSAFSGGDDDGLRSVSSSPYETIKNGRKNSNTDIGFDPAKVPTELLTSSSQALRVGRGEVLRDILRQYEIQAIGQDGMAGDNIEKGGGHYRQVSMVSSFLEGYRRAQVRRIARETTSLLLDRLVSEGVQGLDVALATMVRSSDDTTTMDAGGAELNDSLIEYLNDAIRQQEKKVQKTSGSSSSSSKSLQAYNKRPTKIEIRGDEDDPIDKLWTVSMEDGKRVESLDPNDPEVKRVLERELELESQRQSDLAVSLFGGAAGRSDDDNASPPAETILLLLKLLRERIKAEAAFSPDEKGRNLRLLAYCLRLPTDAEREQLMLKDLGSSIDRLDSFVELVQSSIEYGESASYQLKPTKSNALNLPLLKSLLGTAKDLRERQAWKASGVR